MYGEKTFSPGENLIYQQSCLSKGCCWDNDVYESMFEKTDQVEKVHIDCKWLIEDQFIIPPGFPSLEKGLKSCCEFSPCYQKQSQNISKKTTEEVTSPVPTDATKKPKTFSTPQPSVILPYKPIIKEQYENWSEWTACVIGTQYQTRERMINRYQQKESRFCPEEEWTTWRILSYCNRHCGGGSQTYVRNCYGTGCRQQSEYAYVRCNTHPCHSWIYG